MTLRFVSGGIVAILLALQPGGATLRAPRSVNGVDREENTQLGARRIWEQALSAKGGRERLHAVQNVVISTIGNYTTASGHKNTVRTEAFFAFPNKIWRWMDYRPDVLGLTVETYNFDTRVKYVINSDNPPPIPEAIRPSETSISHSHGVLSYLLETEWLTPELVSANTDQIGQRTVDVVHTMLRDSVEGFAPENKYIDFAFDRETHLPIRVSYYHMRGDEKVLDVAENLSEYASVNGIKFPQRAEMDGRLERMSIQINVEYNKDLFEKPPSIAAGTAAWRPKTRN